MNVKRESADRTITRTELFVSLYVTLSWLFLALLGKIPSGISAHSLNSRLIWGLVGTVSCAVLAGTTSYWIRRRIRRASKSVFKDPTTFSQNDWFSLGYGATLFLLGIGAMAFPPAASNLLYIFMMAIMAAVLALNTYFVAYWHDREGSVASSKGAEGAKLEHAEWALLFANTTTAFLVTIGGAVVSYLILQGTRIPTVPGFKERPPQPTWSIYVDGFLMWYCGIGPPILFLLRPMHAAMVQIRARLTASSQEPVGENSAT